MAWEAMLDLETLGKKPGCVVLSIGAVLFDPYEGVLMPNGHFYTSINSRYAQNIGLQIEADTLLWWLRQDEHVRAAAFSGELTCHEAVSSFAAYIEHVDFVWSHGAAFDIPILDAVFDRCGIKTPWDHRGVQDTRTLFRPLSIDYNDYYGPTDKKHHPVNDARACARAVMVAYNKLGLAPRSRVNENDGTR